MIGLRGASPNQRSEFRTGGSHQRYGGAFGGQSVQEKAFSGTNWLWNGSPYWRRGSEVQTWFENAVGTGEGLQRYGLGVEASFVQENELRGTKMEAEAEGIAKRLHKRKSIS